MFLTKLDASGTHLSSYLFGDAHRHVGTVVCIDNAGRVVVVGEFTGEINFGFGAHSVLGNLDAFVARFPREPIAVTPSRPAAPSRGAAISFALRPN